MSMSPRRFDVLCALFAAGLALCLSPQARAAEPPRQWAVLIAVQEHDERALNLKFTENDVQKLRQTLVERAGLSKDNILQMTDGTADRRPTLANLRRELPAFLQNPNIGKDDRLIVFFSGHGVPLGGKTYLVPRDFKRSDATATALPLAEVRDALNKCPAKVKFLILDCCHAGDDKDAEATLPSSAVAKAIDVQKVPGCVVLASCRDDEKSLEWRERKQGLFTYWLCKALEGAAANERGQVTIPAVNRYVHERVSQTADELFNNASQNPVMFGKVEGAPVVLTLRPESPESLCRRLAETIDLEARRRKLKKVGVLEFMQPLGRSDKLVPANLPAYCAEQVRLALVKLGAGGYEVLDAAKMQDASKGVKVEAVGEPQAMRRLGEAAGGLEGVVTGTLRRRGRGMAVECELMATADGSSLVKPSGLLPLSEEGLGDEGLSFDNRNRPPGGPYDDKVRQHVEEQAQEGHPLLSPDFPFRIELYAVQARPGEKITDATPRKKKDFVQAPVEGPGGKRRTDLLVAARDGEVFEIHVANKSKQKVALLLLVDGLNTLGQKRERLGRGRPWVLDAEREYAIPGWTLPPRTPGGKDVIKRFQFTDVSKSVAGRQNFGESIGLITAAVYAEHGRALGVGEGPEEERKLETVDFRVGRLLGVVNIRYVDETELNK